MTSLTTMKETLKALIDTLHFSTIVPAILFVNFNLYFIMPCLFPKFEWKLSNPDVLTWITTSALLISYILYAFNTFLIKILEGYFWEYTFLKKHKEIKTKYYCDKMQEKLDQDDKTVDTEFPKAKRFILPTRFGNSIAAAEYYAIDRYKIDPVTVWPRLVPIIIKDNYSEFISQQKSLMDTMLNLMYIILICGIEFWLISFYNHNFIISIFCAVILFVVVNVLYIGCINAAIGWGFTIRVAFDIFKNKLRQDLNLKPVNSYHEEIEQWDDLSKFFITGDIRDIKNINNLFKYPNNFNTNEK